MGVLAYELATGNSPFYNKDRQIQYKNIRNTKLTYPEYLSMNLVSFIGGLLKKDPKERMTLEEAMDHVWIKENTE